MFTKRVEVEIEGINPLLMNNPQSMLTEEKGMRSSTKKYDNVEEAEKRAYRTEDKMLYIPSEAIFSCILNGASFKKIGKFSAKSIFAGNITIEPRQVPLNTKKYEIDLRTVVISMGKKKNRIIRARPRLDKWKASFEIVYNEKFITDSDMLKNCLEEAGMRIGLLDFSPRCNGSFGTFKVNKFKEMK